MFKIPFSLQFVCDFGYEIGRITIQSCVLKRCSSVNVLFENISTILYEVLNKICITYKWEKLEEYLLLKTESNELITKHGCVVHCSFSRIIHSINLSAMFNDYLDHFDFACNLIIRLESQNIDFDGSLIIWGNYHAEQHSKAVLYHQYPSYKHQRHFLWELG